MEASKGATANLVAHDSSSPDSDPWPNEAELAERFRVTGPAELRRLLESWDVPMVPTSPGRLRFTVDPQDLAAGLARVKAESLGERRQRGLRLGYVKGGKEGRPPFLKEEVGE